MIGTLVGGLTGLAGRGLVGLAGWLALLPFRMLRTQFGRWVLLLATLAVVFSGVIGDAHTAYDRVLADFLRVPHRTSPHTTVPEGKGQPGVSGAAQADIPPDYLTLYRSAARTCPGLSWSVLAGIGKVETNHGRGWPPDWTATAGIARGTENFAGAGGPMQFLAGTWAIYGRGGDRWDPRDAIPAAAGLLCANGARGGRDVRGAIYAYNHSWKYVGDVLANARRYQRSGR
jgi:hypothetical protein